MYKIDRSTNRINRLAERRFTDLGFQERQHLQEWLSNQPDVLGEDLLIIQKEFDGFNDTRERLDLLALDKTGQLVLIENKLDDSGRDVVWQALKYAAYCSSLTKEQILDIFQRYLDRCHGETSPKAMDEICKFLDQDAPENIMLNEGNGQRIILVAANFRKEVTATVMWLRSHGLSVKCVKVTPYSLDNDLILDAKQIIPVPEAEDFMIRLNEKERSEADAKDTQRRSHQLRLQYWTQTLEALRVAGVIAYANVRPSRDNWIVCASNVGSGAHYSLVFTQNEARVQLNLVNSNIEINKRVYDRLNTVRPLIEKQFGAPMDWRRMDDNISSRIGCTQSFDGFNKDVWPDMIKWMVTNHQRLVAAIQGNLEKAMANITAE